MLREECIDSGLFVAKRRFFHKTLVLFNVTFDQTALILLQTQSFLILRSILCLAPLLCLNFDAVLSNEASCEDDFMFLDHLFYIILRVLRDCTLDFLLQLHLEFLAVSVGILLADNDGSFSLWRAFHLLLTTNTARSHLPPV